MDSSNRGRGRASGGVVVGVEVENTLVESATSEKPVRKVAAAGLTPMLPVTIDVGTLEIAVLARTTKLPEVPRPTGEGPIAVVVPVVNVQV